MEQLAKDLESSIEDFLSISSQITHSHWHEKPRHDKWAPIEILGHLIDSANNNIQRLVRGTYEERFKVSYQQNEWVAAQKYLYAQEADVLQLWIHLNKQMARIMRNYPKERLAILSDVGREQIEFLSMLDIAKSYVEHLRHHLQQIRASH